MSLKTNFQINLFSGSSNLLELYVYIIIKLINNSFSEQNDENYLELNNLFFFSYVLSFATYLIYISFNEISSECTLFIL